MQTVSIKVDVKTPIVISPRYIFFKGQPGQKLKRVVQITAKQERPLKIIPDGFDLKKVVSFEIKEIKEGKQYQLLLTATPKEPGVFRGTLKLTTNYPEKPEIIIPIKVNVQNRLQNEKPKRNS